jgi:Peptidase family M28
MRQGSPVPPVRPNPAAGHAPRGGWGLCLPCRYRLGALAGLALIVGWAANGAAQTVPLRYSLVVPAQVDSRIESAAYSNLRRETALEQMFSKAGCLGTRLSEERIRSGRFSNVICTLPGTSDAEIIVGAHFDHAELGRGVVDNWSGAALLPSIFQGMASQPRRHTLVFIGFGEEEEGLVGSEYYARHLTPAERRRIRVMINLDSLGLGPTKIWLTHSDRKYAAMLFGIARFMHLPLAVMNADRVGDDDSHSFIRFGIPTVMLHSITAATWPVLHTAKDNIREINLGDYYDSYRLIMEYVAYLDSTVN